MISAIERRVSDLIAANRGGDHYSAAAIYAELISDGVCISNDPCGVTWRQPSGDIMRGAIVGAPAVEGGY